jgi:hypothetical protein
MNVGKQTAPLVAADEVLGDVSRHDGKIRDVARHVSGAAEDPFDGRTARAPASDVEHRLRWVYADHLAARTREIDGERPCPAADIGHGSGTDGFSDHHVEVVVPPTDALCVIYRCETRILGPQLAHDTKG